MENSDQNKSIQLCNDISDCIELSARAGLFLKPIARLNITVTLPQLKSGQSISNWEVMEKLRAAIAPEKFTVIKVTESTGALKFIKFDAEIENKKKLNYVITRIDKKGIKLSGFTDLLKIHAVEAKLPFPSRHDWDSFFRDAKHMNEMKPGERPDTVYLQDLPCVWFTLNNAGKPSEYGLRKIFETFGEIRSVDIPCADPHRHQMSSSVSGINLGTFSFKDENLFDAYIQFKEYIGFAKCMHELQGKKLVFKGDKTWCSNIKVDFDKTRHLSEKAIKKRMEEKEKLVLAQREKEIQNRRAKHFESMKEESERMAHEESLKMKKEEKLQKKQEKEQRRKQREIKRRMKKMQSKDDPEKEEKAIASIEDKMSKKIALEERKLLIAQRKLESIRLLDALFDRIKINHRKEVLTLRAMEGGNDPSAINKKEDSLSNTEWFNDDCKSSDRLRKFYRARYQKAPKDLNAKAMYLNAKKKYKSVCKMAKKAYFELRKKEEDGDNDMVTKEKKLREKLINSLKRQQQEAMVHQQKRVEKVIQGKILDKSEVGSNDAEEDINQAANNSLVDSDSDSSLSSSDSSIPEDIEKPENKPSFLAIQGPMGVDHMNGPPPGFFPPNGPPMEWGPMPPMPPPFMNNDPFSPNFEPPFNGPPNFYPGPDGMQFMQRGRGNMNMRMQRGFRGMPFNPFFRGRGQWDHMNRRNFNQRGRWVNRGRGKDNMGGKKQQQDQPVETKWFRRDKAYQERRSFKPDRSSSSGSRSRSRHRTRSWSASRSRTRSRSRSSRRWSSRSRSRSRRRTRSRSQSRRRSERSRSRSHKSGNERKSRSKSQSKKKSRSRSGSKKRDENENKEDKATKSRSGSRENIKSRSRSGKRSRSGSGSHKSRSRSQSRSRSRSSQGRSRNRTRSRSKRRSRSSRGRSRSSRGRSRSSRGRSRSSRRRSRSRSRSRSHSRRRSSHHKKRGRKNDYDSDFEMSSEEKWYEEYPQFGEEFYPNPNFMPFHPQFQNFQHPNQDFRGRGRGGRFQNNQHQQWNWRGRRPNRNNRGNWRGRNQQQHQQGGRGFQPPNYYNPHYADMPYEEEEPPEEENIDMAEEYHDLYRKYFTSIAEKEASNRRKQSKGKDDKEGISEDEKSSIKDRNKVEKSAEHNQSPKKIKVKKKEKPAMEDISREEPKAFKRSYSSYRSKVDKEDSEIEATPKKGKSKSDKSVDQEYQSKEQQARYEIMSRLSKRPMEESDSERDDFMRKDSASSNKRTRKYSDIDDHDIEWIGSDKDDDGKLYSDRHSERNLKERLSSGGSRRPQGFRNFRSRGRGNFENRPDFRDNRRGRGGFIHYHDRKLYEERGSPPDMRKLSPFDKRKETSPSDKRKGNFADRKRHYSSPDSRKGDFNKERDHSLERNKLKTKLRKQSRDSSERDYSSEREYGQRKRDFEREMEEKKKLQVFELETRYREEEERIRAQVERDKMRDRSLETKSRRNIRKRQLDSDEDDDYKTDRRSFKQKSMDSPHKEMFEDRSSEERAIKHKKKLKSDENMDDRSKGKPKKKKRRD